MDDNRNTLEDVFQKSYEASLSILRNVVPYIDEDDFIRQRLSDYVQSIACALALMETDSSVVGSNDNIAIDVVAKCCEVVVMLNYCRDLHSQFINAKLCDSLISTYRSIQSQTSKHPKVNKVIMEGIGC